MRSFIRHVSTSKFLLYISIVVHSTRQIVFSLLGSQLPFSPGLNNVVQERKSVAIVGAGPSGLVMLKTLLDMPEHESWKIVLFEERENVGGIWCVST